MSEEVECSLCGRDGYPPEGCDLCHGRAKPQARAHTLSEERVNPKKYKTDRYSRTGNVSPKIINLPGSDPKYGQGT